MRGKRIEPGIYDAGDGRYLVVVNAPTPAGRWRQQSETCDTIREARRVRDRLRGQAEAGQVAADGSSTAAELVASWIDHRRRQGKIRPTTERRYLELLASAPWPEILRVRAAKLDAVRLQAGVDGMAESGRDPRQTFAVIRAAFRQAVRWKLLRFSPADGVELPSRRRPELTLPTFAELERLLAGAGDISEPFRAGLTIAAACGLRRSEVVGLRWSEADLEGRVLHVRRGVHSVKRDGGGSELLELEPKSERGRRAVEIPAAAAAVLERYKAAQAERRILLGDAWAPDWPASDVVVDNGLGRPFHPDAFGQRWRNLRQRVGVRAEVRLHDLRALYVTETLAAGVDAGIVSRQAGHARADFTRDVYQRVRREDARAAADAIDAALGSAFDVASVDLPLTSEGGDVVELRPNGR
jgi:integrase